MTDLSMTEGEDVTLTTTLTDSNGSAIDITDYKFLFTVKREITDTDTDAIISKEVISGTIPTSGITVVQIDRADTLSQYGRMVYDYDWIDSTDKRRKIEGGIFQINQAVGDSEI